MCLHFMTFLSFLNGSHMGVVVLAGREWAQKTSVTPTQTLTVLKPSNRVHTHTHTREALQEKKCYDVVQAAFLSSST